MILGGKRTMPRIWLWRKAGRARLASISRRLLLLQRPPCGKSAREILWGFARAIATVLSACEASEPSGTITKKLVRISVNHEVINQEPALDGHQRWRRRTAVVQARRTTFSGYGAQELDLLGAFSFGTQEAARTSPASRNSEVPRLRTLRPAGPAARPVEFHPATMR